MENVTETELTRSTLSAGETEQSEVNVNSDSYCSATADSSGLPNTITATERSDADGLGESCQTPPPPVTLYRPLGHREWTNYFKHTYQEGCHLVCVCARLTAPVSVREVGEAVQQLELQAPILSCRVVQLAERCWFARSAQPIPVVQLTRQHPLYPCHHQCTRADPVPTWHHLLEVIANTESIEHSKGPLAKVFLYNPQAEQATAPSSELGQDGSGDASDDNTPEGSVLYLLVSHAATDGISNMRAIGQIVNNLNEKRQHSETHAHTAVVNNSEHNNSVPKTHCAADRCEQDSALNTAADIGDSMETLTARYRVGSQLSFYTTMLRLALGYVRSQLPAALGAAGSATTVNFRDLFVQHSTGGGDSTGDSGTGHCWTRLVRGQLERRVTEQLVQQCRRRQVTVGTALSAAAAVAAAHMAAARAPEASHFRLPIGWIVDCRRYLSDAVNERAVREQVSSPLDAVPTYFSANSGLFVDISLSRREQLAATVAGESAWRLAERLSQQIRHRLATHEPLHLSRLSRIYFRPGSRLRRAHRAAIRLQAALSGALARLTQPAAPAAAAAAPPHGSHSSLHEQPTVSGDAMRMALLINNYGTLDQHVPTQTHHHHHQQQEQQEHFHQQQHHHHYHHHHHQQQQQQQQQQTMPCTDSNGSHQQRRAVVVHVREVHTVLRLNRHVDQMFGHYQFSSAAGRLTHDLLVLDGAERVHDALTLSRATAALITQMADCCCD